jgi:hypothetical protein
MENKMPHNPKHITHHYFKNSPLFAVLTAAWKNEKDEELKKISVIFNNLREYYDAYIELESAYFAHYISYYKHAKQVYIDYKYKEHDAWLVETDFEQVLFVTCDIIGLPRYSSWPFAHQVCESALKFESAKQQVVALDTLFNGLLSQIDKSYPIYSRTLIDPTRMKIEIESKDEEGKPTTLLVPLLSNIRFFDETIDSLNLDSTNLTEEEIKELIDESQVSGVDTNKAQPSNLLPRSQVSAAIASALSMLVWENEKLFHWSPGGAKKGLAMSDLSRAFWKLGASNFNGNFNEVDGHDLRNFWLSENQYVIKYRSDGQVHQGPVYGPLGLGARIHDVIAATPSLHSTFNAESVEYNNIKWKWFDQSQDHAYSGGAIQQNGKILSAPWDSFQDFINEQAIAYPIIAINAYQFDALAEVTNTAQAKTTLDVEWYQPFMQEFHFDYEAQPEANKKQKWIELSNLTSFQEAFGATDNTGFKFYDMYNTADHQLIADYWTKDWQTPFVTKQRDNFYYPGTDNIDIVLADRKWSTSQDAWIYESVEFNPHGEGGFYRTAMWDLGGTGNDLYKLRPASVKFWEYDDLRYAAHPQDLGYGSPLLNQAVNSDYGSTRSNLVLDHVAWYYPKLAAVIAELVYKIHNIALHTRCIEVFEEKPDEPTDDELPWNVTIVIKHMPNGYEKFETSSGLSSLQKSQFENINSYGGYEGAGDTVDAIEAQLNNLDWYNKRKIWYDMQPEVHPFPLVKFKVNKKAIQNDLNERKFVFDK